MGAIYLFKTETPVKAFSWRHGRGKRWTLTDTPTESRFEPSRKYMFKFDSDKFRVDILKFEVRKEIFSVFSGLCYRNYTLYSDRNNQQNQTDLMDHFISYC